jgi:hypothetical protein
MNHLNLEVIKGAYKNDREAIKFGERLRFDQVKWLIEQVEKYRNTLTYYASESTYQLDKWGSPIERDSGDLARKVLDLK